MTLPDYGGHTGAAGARVDQLVPSVFGAELPRASPVDSRGGRLDRLGLGHHTPGSWGTDGLPAGACWRHDH
jgi:hypothetical protein